VITIGPRGRTNVSELRFCFSICSKHPSNKGISLQEKKNRGLATNCDAIIFCFYFCLSRRLTSSAVAKLSYKGGYNQFPVEPLKCFVIIA